MKHAGFTTYDKLYTSCVIPILDYCSSVWGYKDSKTMDSVQNRAARFYLGVHRFTPNLAVVGETGWLPCMYRRWINIVRYWNRLLQLPNARLTKKTFLADYDKCINNWCSDIKSMLILLNLEQHFETKSVIHLDLVKSRVRQFYSDIWATNVRSVPKLRTYVTFKNTFESEPYLYLNLSHGERSFFAQFRCGILPLRIETGRYVGEAPGDRLCQMCTLQQIEDEQHFLLECPLYDDIRQNLNSDIPLDLSENNKLVFLVNNRPRKVAKFIMTAYNRRQSILYN